MLIQIYEVNSISSQKVLFLDSLFLFWTAFSAILFINIICIARWLFEANFEILHCSIAFARRHKH